MNHIVPLQYYTDEIVKYIDDQVESYGVTRFEDMTNEDQEYLAGIFLKYTDFLDQHCCITDCDDADQNINLFRRSLMLGGMADEDFVKTLKRNAVKYYKDPMAALIHERYCHAENLKCNYGYYDYEDCA